MQAVTGARSVEPAERGTVAFGPFVFDRTSHFLSKNGVELPLPPRVLGVLALLVDRPGRLVAKQEMMSAVWRDAFVTETSLAEAVSVLRQALGDDPQHPTYIQTIHRRGYRFIAEIKDLPAEAGSHKGDASHGLDRGFRLEAEEAKEAEPRLSLFVPWIITIFAVLIAAVAVWKYLNAAAPPARSAARFTIALPDGIALSGSGAPIAISRDGSLIAFAGCRVECGIYLRPLSQAEPTLVAGTSGGASPFFSPDGRWLGYFAGGRLQKIALAGGSPVMLAEAAAPNGATWTRDGQIVFAGSTRGGLSVVPASGGAVRSLTTPAAGESTHAWPDALTDGSAVVFTVRDAAQPDQQYAGIVSMRTGTWGRLLDGVSAVRAPMPGYLLAQRRTDLVGVAFDNRTLSAAGLSVAVSTGTVTDEVAPQFALTAAGTLAIGRPHATTVYVVLDWTTELRRLVPAPQPPMPR